MRPDDHCCPTCCDQDPRKEFQVCDYVFVETKDPATLRHIFRQRHGVYVFERYIEPDVFPGGVFSDVFDDVSAHIAAFDAFGSIVGSSRVVPPSPLGLPTQRLFRLPELELGSAVVGEVGRLAVNPPHRGHSRVVVTGPDRRHLPCAPLSGTLPLPGLHAPRAGADAEQPAHPGAPAVRAPAGA